jgi:hypothetical protein
MKSAKNMMRLYKDIKRPYLRLIFGSKTYILTSTKISQLGIID